MKDKKGIQYEVLAREGKMLMVKKLNGTVRFLAMMLPDQTLDLYFKLGR